VKVRFILLLHSYCSARLGTMFRVGTNKHK